MVHESPFLKIKCQFYAHLRLMLLHMTPMITSISKFPLTKLTFVRRLSRMNSHVNFERIRIFETFVTHFTLRKNRFEIFVFHQVPFEDVVVNVGFSANFASERSLILREMRSHVRVIMTFFEENFGTFFTLPTFFQRRICVDVENVRFENSLVRKLHVAVRTRLFLRFSNAMSVVKVFFEMWFTREHGRTMRAQKFSERREMTHNEMIS